MKKILFAALATAMIGGFAAPSFAAQGDGPQGANNAHGANGNNAGNMGGGEGNHCDPNPGSGNDS